jgi:CheY-like chemotaxis protein
VTAPISWPQSRPIRIHLASFRTPIMRVSTAQRPTQHYLSWLAGSTGALGAARHECYTQPRILFLCSGSAAHAIRQSESAGGPRPMSSAQRDSRHAQGRAPVFVASRRSRPSRERRAPRMVEPRAGFAPASRGQVSTPAALAAHVPTEWAPTNTTNGALALLDATATEAQPALRSVSTHRHILIVEDDPLIAGVIRNALEIEGDAAWDVRLAGEGSRALELARAASPDVVLLDVRLPGLDGAEVYHRLRANPQTRQAIVLFLTAGASLDLIHRGIEDGVFLRKPFDVRELVRIVRALLDA